MGNKLNKIAYALDLDAGPWSPELEEKLIARSGELFDRFMELRKQADRDLRHIPHYPWGACEIITKRVRVLAQDQPWMKEWTDEGLNLRRIYGILKDLYFQNALQLGPLYIDPANDTVDVHKTSVEVLPIREVPWVNLGDPAEYRRVGQRYLNLTLYPNLCLPVLFPFMPYIAINPEGHVFPLRHQDVILWKDAASDFQISANWLSNLDDGDRLPAVAEAVLAEAAAHDDFPLEWSPCEPFQIRDLVLPDYRKHATGENVSSLFKTALKLRDRVNRQLHRHSAVIPADELAVLQAKGLAPLARERSDLSWTGR